MEWFPGFCKRYMLRASWSGKDDEERLVEWLPLFSKHNVSEKEADEASIRLMSEGFPPVRGNHAAAMIRVIKAIREETRDARKKEQLSGPVCELCGNSGLVTVPHPSHFDQDGKWKGKYTAAVLCSCPASDKMARFRNNDGAGIPTLAKYEEFCPDWRDWMEWYRREVDDRNRKQDTADRAAGLVEKNPFKNALRQRLQKAGNA